MGSKEKSLNDALRYTSMQTIGLPKRYTSSDTRIWIRAIVLVRKRTMAEVYCIYQRAGDGYMTLIRDCSDEAGEIIDILSIHPYIYLDEARFLPNVGYSRKRYLLSVELQESDATCDLTFINDLSNSEVDIALINEGIRRQLLNSEIDMVNNANNEGVDINGTSVEIELKRKFDAEVIRMREAGYTIESIKKFTESHEKELSALRNGGNTLNGDDSYKSLVEEVREEFETKDEANSEKMSFEGEFNEKELDYDAIHAASEKYRLEQKRKAIRKFNRKANGMDKMLGGKTFLNELGEEETVETLELPEDASKKQAEILNKEERKREREIKKHAMADSAPRKLGRPRGSKNKNK